MNEPKPRCLTVRNVPADVAEALQRARHRYQQSLNQTVLDVLRRGLDLDEPQPHSNGLGRLAGTWSQDDFDLFIDAIAPLGQIDEDWSTAR